jgi:hypothetical protein
MPMDAALNGFDVGHIAIVKSALEEVNPIVDLNTPIFQLMEGLKVEVLKTGKPGTPPPSGSLSAQVAAPVVAAPVITTPVAAPATSAAIIPPRPPPPPRLPPVD